MYPDHSWNEDVDASGMQGALRSPTNAAFFDPRGHGQYVGPQYAAEPQYQQPLISAEMFMQQFVALQEQTKR